MQSVTEDPVNPLDCSRYTCCCIGYDQHAMGCRALHKVLDVSVCAFKVLDSDCNVRGNVQCQPIIHVAVGRCLRLRVASAFAIMMAVFGTCHVCLTN